jgi:hypothetical protein
MIRGIKIFSNYFSFDAKNEIKEIEQINVELDRLHKSISPVIRSENERFMFNKYNELKEELTKQYKIILKHINRNNENKKLEKLMLERTELNNKEGRELLSNEQRSLDSSLRVAENIKKVGLQADEEIESQDKTLLKNKDKVLLIMSKVPIIHKLLTSIKFHRYKEKIILGMVIGVIVFLGLYLSYY